MVSLLGQDALSIHEVLAIQGVLEGQWREALVEKDWEALFDIATTGAGVVTGMGTAFRGEEFGLCRLGATRESSEKGSKHSTDPHLAVAFYGKLKCSTGGRRMYVLPLALESESGILYKRWLYRLFFVYNHLGVKEGPLFRKSADSSESATIRDLDVGFHQVLKRVQEEKPDLIPPDIDVTRKYSVYRSLRRGAQSQAVNKNTPEATRNLIGRWKQQERAGLKDASLPMPEHYSDVRVLLPAFIVYSRRQ